MKTMRNYMGLYQGDNGDELLIFYGGFQLVMGDLQKRWFLLKKNPTKMRMMTRSSPYDSGNFHVVVIVRIGLYHIAAVSFS